MAVKEDREIEGHHGDRGRQRRLSLHDLNIERHGEVEHRLHRHHREHGDDRGALGGRHRHPQIQQRRTAGRGNLPAAADEQLEE
jgi:hypothetical protein